MVILDRGYLDGETISRVKKERHVDVIIPLRSDMKAYTDSIATAYHPTSGSWEAHPTRENQQIKKVEYVNWMWDECTVAWMCGAGTEGRKGWKWWKGRL
jgi:hypothetical protein